MCVRHSCGVGLTEHSLNLPTPTDSDTSYPFSTMRGLSSVLLLLLPFCVAFSNYFASRRPITFQSRTVPLHRSQTQRQAIDGDSGDDVLNPIFFADPLPSNDVDEDTITPEEPSFATPPKVSAEVRDAVSGAVSGAADKITKTIFQVCGSFVEEVIVSVLKRVVH